MAIRDFVLPYNDDVMTYDYYEQRYLLTPDYVKGLISEDDYEVNEFDIEERAKILVDQISRATYDVILRYKDSKYFKKTMYYLAHSKGARQALKEIMASVAYYSTVEGGFENSYLTGINLQDSTKLKVDLEDAVGVRGKTVIETRGLGTRILPDLFDYVEPSEEDRW